MTGAKDKNKESAQPKRTSARLREVQLSTTTTPPTKDAPKEAVSPGDGPSTRGMATRASVAKDGAPLLTSPGTPRKRRAQTTPPGSANKTRKSTPEMIDLVDDVSDEPPKDIKPSPKSPKKPRRSKRDIRRPKFDDEIVTAPAPSTTAKERKKKAGSVVDSGVKPKISKPSVSEELPTTPKTTGSKVRAKSVAPKSDEEAKPAKSDEEPSSPSASVTKDEKPKDDAKPEPASEDPMPTSSASSVPPQKPATQPKKSRPTKNKSKTPAVKPNLLTYSNPIYNGVVNNLQNRWTVEDDIILMASVQHLCDLPAVLAHCKFSQPYSLHDLDERWYLMLYDKQVSKFVRDRIHAQTVEFVSSVYKKIPFSADEDKLIKGVVNVPKRDIEVFNKLRKNKTFPIWRTAEDLMDRFKKLTEVPDKKKDKKVSNVSLIHEDIEQNLDFVNLAQKDVPTDNDSNTIPRDLVKAETVYGDSRRAPHDAIAGSTLSPQMPVNALAQLRGRVVAFNIIDSQVIIGRSTPERSVDINLLHEGPCNRTSKIQAVIKLVEETDTFFIFNIGQNPFFVDDHVIYAGQKFKLESNSKVTFGLLDMLFLRNEAKRTKPLEPEPAKPEPTTNGTTVSEAETSKATPAPVTTTAAPAVTSSQSIPVVPVTTSAPIPLPEIKKLQIKDESNSVTAVTVSPKKQRPRLPSQPLPKELDKQKQDAPAKAPGEKDAPSEPATSSKSDVQPQSTSPSRPGTPTKPSALPQAPESSKPAAPVEAKTLHEEVSQLVQQEKMKRFQLAKAIKEAQAFNQTLSGANAKTTAPKPSSATAPSRPVVFKKPALPNKNQKKPDNEKK
uniref:FHA domain-containing protein n=1 Tax=Panagrellus redivivus TaxID=6233 RepID=A0A7E4VTW5_PANRE